MGFAELILGAILGVIVWYLIKRKWRQLFPDRSRVIPEDVKDAVRKKCYNECVVCTTKHPLDFHHRKEFADGGEHTVENLVLLCSNHHDIITRNGGK